MEPPPGDVPVWSTTLSDPGEATGPLEELPPLCPEGEGPLVLPEDLAPGAYRKLTAEELAALKNEQPKRNED